MRYCIRTRGFLAMEVESRLPEEHDQVARSRPGEELGDGDYVARRPACANAMHHSENSEGEDDVVDFHFQVPERATAQQRRKGRLSPLFIPDLDYSTYNCGDDDVSSYGPLSPCCHEQPDGYQPSRHYPSGRSATPVAQYHREPYANDMRRARSFSNIAESHDDQRRRPRPGYQRSFSDLNAVADDGYRPPSSAGSRLGVQPDPRRHSWALPQLEAYAAAPSPRFSVVPARIERHSYCGAQPSPRELVPRSARSSLVQQPSVYLLTPDRAHSPFQSPDEDGSTYFNFGPLKHSVESLVENSRSPSTTSLPSPAAGPTRRVSTVTLTDGSNSIRQIPTDSGQPMVLQLVLPRSQSNDSGQGPLTPSTPRENHSPSKDGYDAVAKSDTLPNASTTCTVSTTNSMTALVKQDGHSTYPQLPNSEQAVVPVNGDAKHKGPLPPPPTSEEEKKEIFKENFTNMLSSIYAIFIVMLGGVVYVADILQPMKAYGEIFTIYLTLGGLAWLGFLHFDIRLYLNSVSIWKKQNKKGSFAIDNEGYDKTLDNVSKSETLPSGIEPSKPPPESYCFKTGRHSGSFYLKIGAAVFCFGHLIHEGLLLSRQIAYFTSEQKYLQQCADVIALILSILHPLFSFYQLFIVFKYSNIVINRYKEIARFAIMHIIGANLCLWVHTIIRETEEALAHHPEDQTMNLTHYHDNDTDSEDDRLDTCVSRTILSEFTIQAAPYLYPFTIEYSLLQVGIWLIMWYNIGDMESIEAERLQSSHSNEDSHNSGHYPEDDSYKSNLVIHVDCHSANRGLFAGLFILLATVVSVIIFFVAMTNDEYIQTGVVINNVSDTVLLLLMIFSVVFAYRQTARLDFNKHAVNFLDDFLLYIALPCFFLYAIFNVVASVAVKNPFIIVINILCVIQVAIQTPFIVDGLRRCSNSYDLRYSKPGREIVTFLIVCNVASWILETFEIKSYEAHSDRIEYYGSFLWTLLSHVTLPLTLFYRFHSSVCLVDMWKSAYEQGDAH